MALYIKNPDSNGECCDCSSRAAPCDTCTPTICTCYLDMGNSDSISGPPYDSYQNAVDAIATNTSNNNCYFYPASFGDVTNTCDSIFNETNITTTALSSSSTPTLGLSMSFKYSVSLKAGSTLTIPYTLSSANAQAFVFSCDLMECGSGSVFDGSTDSSGSLSVVAPTTNEYILTINASSSILEGEIFITSLSINFSVSSSQTMWVNPVRLKWDDAGTTRYLWVEPKMILPLGGSLYASKADAQTAFTDDDVAGCIGYIISSANGTIPVFTASGSNFSAVYTATQFVFTSSAIYCSINVIGGATVSMAYSITAVPFLSQVTVIDFYIYDTDNNVVSFKNFNTTPSGTVSGTLVSDAIPFSGKYNIQMIYRRRTILTPILDSLSLNYTLSSSNTMTVNQIEGLYDLDLQCAGRVDC